MGEVAATSWGESRSTAPVLTKPAYGQQTDQEPECDTKEERSDQEAGRVHWASRVFDLMIFLALAVVNIGWLILLVYAFNRFALDPIYG